MRTVAFGIRPAVVAASAVRGRGIVAPGKTPRPRVSTSFTARAFGEDTKGAIGGAIVGGMLLGPFGALFGAQIGASFGADAEQRKREVEELRRRGVTPEMVDLAQRVGKNLAEAEEGLELCIMAAQGSRELVNDLEAGISEAYNDAMAAVRADDDVAARRHLQEKAERTRRLEAARPELEAAEARVKRTRQAVELQAERVKEVERLIQRSMASAASANASSNDLSYIDSAGAYEDPLEKKFKDLEGK